MTSSRGFGTAFLYINSFSFFLDMSFEFSSGNHASERIDEALAASTWDSSLNLYQVHTPLLLFPVNDERGTKGSSAHPFLPTQDSSKGQPMLGNFSLFQPKFLEESIAHDIFLLSPPFFSFHRYQIHILV